MGDAGVACSGYDNEPVTGKRGLGAGIHARGFSWYH